MSARGMEVATWRALVITLLVALPARAQCPDMAPEQRVALADPAAEETIVRALAVQGDRLVTGHPGEDGGAFQSGVVRVFEKISGTWTEQAELVRDCPRGCDPNCPPDCPRDYDALGSAVDLDGDRVVAGAPAFVAGTGLGAAYLFVHDSGTWRQEARLALEDPVENDLFGNAVAIDGDVVAVGAPRDGPPGSPQGAVYIFRRVGTSWVQELKLKPLIRSAARFGGSVALADGRLVVGVEDDGHARVYRDTPCGWKEEARLYQGNGLGGHIASVAFDGKTVVMGKPALSSLSEDQVFVFERCDAGWSRVATLTGTQLDRPANFGHVVDVLGDVIVVGAPTDTHLFDEEGSVHVFQRDVLGGWLHQRRIVLQSAVSRENLGFAVAVGPQDVLASADELPPPPGSVFAGFVQFRCGEQDCADGLDDDADGADDCADVGCTFVAACATADWDGDGIGNVSDCAPHDATAEVVQPVVPMLSVAKTRATTHEALLQWTDVSAELGSGTTYDVGGGLLCQLHEGGTVTGQRLVRVSGQNTWTDRSPLLADASWYVVRAQNCCSTPVDGDWGTDSFGVDRLLCP